MSITKAKTLIKELYPKESCTFIENYFSRNKKKALEKISHKDCILITYPNHIHEKNTPTLKTLHSFIQKLPFNTIHILPMHPYSSDYGFAITDFSKINSHFGNWNDVKRITKSKKVMIDFVANHTSAKHPWFKEFLQNKNSVYIAYNKKIQTTKVFRPRSTPLLTKFSKKYVWTTFSKDQVDLNYAHIETLKRMLQVFQRYLELKPAFIRIDAAAFLWKNPYSSSINLKKNHLLIQLFTLVAKHQGCRIITETNLPNKDNNSYYNDGVIATYNFALPPLLLYSILKKDPKKLVAYLKSKTNSCLHLNITATHDGIGLSPLKGILSEKEISWMILELQKRGSKISYRTVKAKKNPYEANITFPSATKDKFLLSQALPLFLKGIPTIYMGSVLNAKNAKIRTDNRSINRQTFSLANVKHRLNRQTSKTLLELITKRISDSNFSYNSPQKLSVHNTIVILKRGKRIITFDFLSGDIMIQ